MSGFTPIGVSPGLMAPTSTATAADLALRGKARDTAQKFETQFLSSMFQHMFEGIETDGPFGGGAGESMFRSLMTEALGKQMTKSGGVGLTDTIQREILKMQGLT